MTLASNYPLLNVFWTMLMVFLFLGWLMLLFRVFADIFRRESSGWSKGLWTLFVVVAPLLGTLIYLIAHGDGMARRDVELAITQQNAVDEYIRQAVGSPVSAADEIAKLAGLHERGVLSDAEFAEQKARVLG